MKRILFVLTILLPSIIKAEGLDEKINEKFMPIAEWWEGLVLTPIPVLGESIPFVLILLILGATFFTIYFSFPGIRRIKIAINTVRGKYDDIDTHTAEKSDLNIDGDVKGTIKDESQEGEVSHFQALATAVSGTVGLGNIAGVAVAIAFCSTSGWVLGGR